MPLRHYTPYPSNGRMEEPGDLVDTPAIGPVKRWLYGVVLAALPIAYGIVGICRRRMWLPGRGGSMEVAGAAAVAFGIVWIAAGAFAHFHFFWGPHPKLWRFADLGKITSAIAFIGGLAVTAYCVLQGLR